MCPWSQLPLLLVVWTDRIMDRTVDKQMGTMVNACKGIKNTATMLTCISSKFLHMFANTADYLETLVQTYTAVYVGGDYF